MYNQTVIPLTVEAIAAIGRTLRNYGQAMLLRLKIKPAVRHRHHLASHQEDLRVAFHDWSIAGRSAG